MSREQKNSQGSVLIETQWNVKITGSANILPFHIVLIETQWNVKLDDEIAHKISKSINRNIVECKDENGDILLNFVRVLIETQWNVKYGDTDNALELNMY